MAARGRGQAPIHLREAQKAELVTKLQAYFLRERDEELGQLAAMLLLDFITAELGPAYYNAGIADATAWLQERSDDLLALQRL
jgi:uncharacterized protein (DUF2164 family)